MKLSICICTYNRGDILRECLASIAEHKDTLSDVEILVVNNNSSDNTLKICSSYEIILPNFRAITESQQGLSYARNRAFQEANSPWVCYLDDDAKVEVNLIDRIIWNIENTDYKVFGGLNYPWYKYGKPDWFKDEYGSYTLPYSKPAELKSNQFLIGSLMVFRKDILGEYNGFNVNLGMRGSTIGYGEETELQIRIQSDGIPILYDPKMIIFHLVPKYKLDIDWWFKAAFSLGRDSILMKSRSISVWNMILIGLVAKIMLVVHLIIYTPKLFSKDYYLENWLLDVFKKIVKRVGVIYTGLLMDKKK